MKINHTADNFADGEELRTYFFRADESGDLSANDFWEIAYVYEGEGMLCRDGSTEPLRSGQFVFSSPGAAHAFTFSKDIVRARLCAAIFTKEYFERIRKDYAQIQGIDGYSLFGLLKSKRSFCLRLTDDRRSNIKNLIWLIAHEYGHMTTGSDAVMRCAATALLVCISRFYENQVNKVVETATDHVIEDIKDYIRTNFSGRITLGSISERVHLSREYLSRYFKQKTGQNISDFILRTRIERAADKIRTTTLPIGDIAEYCGYSSQSNFQKAFRRVTGQSPVEYRNTHKIITEQ